MLRRAALCVVVVVAALVGCASPPPPPPPPPPKKEEPPPPPPEPEEPRTWDEVPKFYGHKCPGPFFSLPEKTTVDALGYSFEIEGSTARLTSAPSLKEGKWTGPLKIGVLGAIKDPEPETRANIKKAMKEFKRLGVHLVVANGDIIGDETGDLAKVAAMIGEEITVPVFVHSGNYEWTTAFTETFVEASKQHPHVLNANLLRHVDLGGVHLFSLPGWSNPKFVKPAACRYGKSDVEALREQIKPLVDKDEVVIVTAHGPPRGRGKQALDFADGPGNVGDEDLALLLKDTPVKFGLFSHILEAGGRATSDPEKQPAIKQPMLKPATSLYINAGSTSSFAWKMNDGKFSKGMAAVVIFDKLDKGGTARATFLKLRK